MLNALKLGKKLTREEMKNISGGGTCAYINGDGEVIRNLSKAEAKIGATETGRLFPGQGRWCCACDKASWF